MLTSPAAVAFVKLFITAETAGDVVPEISWMATGHEIGARIERARAAGYGEIVKQELISRFMMLRQFGRWEQAKGFIDLYADLYTEPSPAIGLPPVASIEFVQNDQYRIVEFELQRDATVRVFAVGESDYYRLYDFGGIEGVLKGQLIWRLRLEQSEDAGGALKNRKVDDIVELPKGTYRLHYRTDGAHSFEHWNDIPPDEPFWGISLYLADPSVRVGDVVGGVRTIQAAPGTRLLDAVEFERGQTPITPWEYFAFVIFLLILASAIVYPPVRLLQRRLAEDKRSFGEIPKPRRTWISALAWIAAVNSVICLGHILPALLAGRLEGLIVTGVPILPGVWWAVLISLPLLSACLVVFLVVAVGISWRKKLWNRPQRIYYTLVVAVAAGYLVLLNHWRVIILPA